MSLDLIINLELINRWIQFLLFLTSPPKLTHSKSRNLTNLKINYYICSNQEYTNIKSEMKDLCVGVNLGDFTKCRCSQKRTKDCKRFVTKSHHNMI